MTQTSKRARRLLILIGTIGAVACDSPGGGGRNAIAGEVVQDAANGDALFPQPDAVATDGTVAPDAVPDIMPDIMADTLTSPPDTVVDTSTVDSASVCAQGCLPAVAQAGPIVVFTQHAETTAPPTLTGGGTPSGGWRLSAVDIYPYGTFTEGFEITVMNEGDTRGRAVFDGDAMQVSLHLDLRIRVDAFGTVGEDTGTSDVALGGCFDAAAGMLTGELGQCDSGWPAGTSPPESMAYSLSSNLRLAIELPPEFLIAMLPAEQQAGASLVIVGPLVLVATLVVP